MSRLVPPSIIGVASQIISDVYTHSEIDARFLAAGFPDAVPEGNKTHKVAAWLRLANANIEDPLGALGRALAEFMDQPIPLPEELAEDFWRANRYEPIIEAISKLNGTFEREGLVYHRGGIIAQAGVTAAAQTLEQRLRRNPIATVQEEFARGLANIDTHPRQALDAACALLESTCKYYLRQANLPIPANQSIGPLWNATARGLGFDPASIEDNDLRKIVSGLYSVADGIGSIRTHAGGAHGRAEPAPGERLYRITPRHARLAINAAHTLTLFVIETMESRGR